MEAFKPILPSPRYLPDDEVVADKRGNPVLERRSFLLDCQLEEDEVKQRYPKLWAHLEEGKAQGVPKRYLCRHRTPWYTTPRPRSSSAEETRSTSTRPVSSPTPIPPEVAHQTTGIDPTAGLC